MPNYLNQRNAFENQFSGMSAMAFTYEDFEITRERLIKDINSGFSEKDRSFLMSFKLGNPDWKLFPITKLKEMPAVQWKLKNLQALIKSNPKKHKELIKKLESLTGA